MSSATVLAVVQLTSTDDREANRRAVEEQVRGAAAAGAKVICLPEMWPFVGSDEGKIAGAESLEGPSMSLVRGLARELGVWIFPGSFAERHPTRTRVYNTATAIDPGGELAGVYRKIHLFDVEIPDGAVFRESDTVTPGASAVVVPTPFGRVGLTVCYDLRFPELYRSLREAGAELVLVPAAFTAHTGKDHWEVLLRARAIEQQVYVAAANQGGWHNPKRQSHGHSMVVDPWGLVVSRVSDGAGFGLATLDPARLQRIRRELPCGTHRRPFEPPTGP